MSFKALTINHKVDDIDVKILLRFDTLPQGQLPALQEEISLT